MSNNNRTPIGMHDKRTQLWLSLLLIALSPWLQSLVIGLPYETNDDPYIILSLKGYLVGKPITDFSPLTFCRGWSILLGELYSHWSSLPWFGLALHISTVLGSVLAWRVLTHTFAISPLLASVLLVCTQVWLFPFMSFTRTAIWLILASMWVLYTQRQRAWQLLATVGLVAGALWRAEALTLAVLLFVCLGLCQCVSWLQLRTHLRRLVWPAAAIAIGLMLVITLSYRNHKAAPSNQLRVQVQDVQGQPRDSTAVSPEAWARFQLIYNFTLLNFFDLPLQEWQTILDKTAPSPLPLEEDWNKFFYQTIDLYRRWEPYGLLSIDLQLYPTQFL
jgi:hypothetical protein